MLERILLRALMLALAAATLAACSGSRGGRPPPPSDPGGGVRAVALDVGDRHSCALMNTGGVKCWGENGNSQLGDGGVDESSYVPWTFTPIDVFGLTSVTALSAGYLHTCVLASGAVKCWGYGFYGQIGDSRYFDQASPVNVSLAAPVSMSAGYDASCAALANGGLACWGSNRAGLLVNTGVGSLAKSWSPVYVDTLATVTAVAVGDGDACGILEDATVRCWGSGISGSMSISNLAGVTKLSAGALHHCALRNDGGVRCWGWNDSGQLGAASLDWYAPVEPTGLGTTVAISAGVEHSCAVVVGGAVKCWGRNDAGQLGDGTRANSMLPVTVAGLSGAATAVAAGLTHTCALLGSGKVQCWGDNTSGKLGLDPVAASSSVTPVDVTF